MKRVLVQVDEGTHVAWKALAFSEGRSMSELARDLIERAVLTERRVDSPSPQGVERAAGGGSLAGGLSSVASQPPRSVSADVAATIPGVQIMRPHMRKDRPAIQCSERVVLGNVCVVCGREV